jgi:hemerythrin-like metal-binding protein
MRFEWNDKLSVGDSTIDTQHQNLYKIINEIDDYVSANNTEKEPLVNIIDRLWWYAMTHFRNEEELMASINYEKLPEHKKIHEEMLAKVRQYHAKAHAGQKMNPEELYTFLAEWLTDHIMQTDMQYKEFL